MERVLGPDLLLLLVNLAPAFHTKVFLIRTTVALSRPVVVSSFHECYRVIEKYDIDAPD